MKRNEQWPRGWNPHVMLDRGVGRWSPARGHDYSVTEQRQRGAGWAVHYLGPGDRTGTLIGFGPTGPEAAEFAMADWDARGAPTQRMRANRLRRNARLRSTMDTRAVREEVEELAEHKLRALGYEDIDCFFEHGQWFVQAWDPREEYQVSYSVVDTSRGLDLEEL